MKALDAEESLRSEIGRLGERGSGRRYPCDLRARLIAFAQRGAASGRSANEMASALGLPACTLSMWLRAARDEAEAPPSFRAVVVRDDAPPRPGALVVETRSGLKISGLGVADVAQLIRSLS